MGKAKPLDWTPLTPPNLRVPDGTKKKPCLETGPAKLASSFRLANDARCRGAVQEEKGARSVLNSVLIDPSPLIFFFPRLIFLSPGLWGCSRGGTESKRTFSRIGLYARPLSAPAQKRTAPHIQVLYITDAGDLGLSPEQTRSPARHAPNAALSTGDAVSFFFRHAPGLNLLSEEKEEEYVQIACLYPIGAPSRTRGSAPFDPR